MSSEKADDIIREEAAVWLARIRGGINGSEERAFQQWYASDIRHADLYDALLDAWEDGEPTASPPVQSLPSYPSRRPWVRIALAAAAVILLMLVGTVAVRSGVDPTRASPTLLASKPTEVRFVTLADGSRVTLDANAAVAVEFSSQNRLLRLQRGRVRFQVAKDGRPFTVQSGDSEVLALGTIFDVERGSGETVISLLEGEVVIRRSNKPASSVRMRPGDRLAVQAGGTIIVPVPAPAETANWSSAMLSYENVRVEEVVAAANRHSDVKIIVAEPALRDKRFTGTINTGDQERLAEAIATMFDGTATREKADSITIHSGK